MHQLETNVEIFNEISEKVHKVSLQEDTYDQIVVAFLIAKSEVDDAMIKMEPYRKLSNAIIIRAVDDYRRSLKRLNSLLKKPEVNSRLIAKTEREIDEIEEFFRSEWYGIMTDISGEDVIRKIRKEVEQ